MLRREVRRGETIPKGYGIAWRIENRDAAACYPMPLNRVLFWGRRLLMWLRYPPALPSSVMLRKERDAGWQEGYTVGFRVGESRERERNDAGAGWHWEKCGPNGRVMVPNRPRGQS